MIELTECKQAGPNVSPAVRGVLCSVAAFAILVGVYARLKGLALPPFAPDEYYMARSVENILRFGFPCYECGGAYLRGLPYQYVVAALNVAGLSPELAVRIVPALSSLLVVPAVFLLGRRVHGWSAGIAAATIMAISLWEVEMGRFGRMYAPFQAIFSWYLVFYLRFTVDGERRAMWPMLALAFLGALTWEGGVMVFGTNLIAPFLGDQRGRLTQRDVIYLVANGLLCAALFRFNFGIDHRFSGTGDEFPPGYSPAAPRVEHFELMAAFCGTIFRHPKWAAGLAIVAATASLPAFWWIRRFRGRWLGVAGLTIALAFGFVHQLAAFVLVLMLMLLTGLVRWRELFNRNAMAYYGAILVVTVFWVAFGLLTPAWHTGTDRNWLSQNQLVLLAYEFVRFPDFLGQLARPWSGTAEVLASGIFLLILISALRIARLCSTALDAERVIVLLVLVLASVVACYGASRRETRYMFFLYPAAIVIAVSVSMHVAESFTRRLRPAAAGMIGALVPLLLFASTEDFAPRHLVRIDQPDVLYRIGISSGQRSHLVPRSDIRGAAYWLMEHGAPGHDLLVNALTGVDFYFDRFDFMYIDEFHHRFFADACRRGTFERWGNLPLVSTIPDLRERITQRERTLMVVSRRNAGPMMGSLAGLRQQVVWNSLDGETQIIEIKPAAGIN